MENASIKVNENFPMSSLAGPLSSLSPRSCPSSHPLVIKPIEPWLASSLTSSAFSGIPKMFPPLASSSYPNLLAAAMAGTPAIASAFGGLHLSALTSLSGLAHAHGGNPNDTNFCAAAADDVTTDSDMSSSEYLSSLRSRPGHRSLWLNASVSSGSMEKIE